MAAEPPVPVPRLAATVLLLRDDPFAVLMVRRRTGGAFSGALVFPGGVVEPDDRDPAWAALIDDPALDPAERALRVAAARETFEEAGVLIGGVARPAARFRATVEQSGAPLAVAGMTHTAHWITPEGYPKRFDAHFYLCAMPAGQIAVADGEEAVALEWVGIPDRALALADDAALPFPTRLNLRRLAESSSVAEAIAAARARPRFTVAPVMRRHAGRAIVTIPAEAGYGVVEDVR